MRSKFISLGFGFILKAFIIWPGITQTFSQSPITLCGMMRLDFYSIVPSHLSYYRTNRLNWLFTIQKHNKVPLFCAIVYQYCRSLLTNPRCLFLKNPNKGAMAFYKQSVSSASRGWRTRQPVSLLPQRVLKNSFFLSLTFSVCSQLVFPKEMLEHDTAYNVYLSREHSFWLPLSCFTGPDGELPKGTLVSLSIAGYFHKYYFPSIHWMGCCRKGAEL